MSDTDGILEAADAISVPRSMLYDAVSKADAVAAKKGGKAARYAFYRSAARALGYTERAPLPDALVHAARAAWPEPAATYVGYKARPGEGPARCAHKLP